MHLRIRSTVRTWQLSSSGHARLTDKGCPLEVALRPWATTRPTRAIGGQGDLLLPHAAPLRLVVETLGAGALELNAVLAALARKAIAIDRIVLVTIGPIGPIGPTETEIANRVLWMHRATTLTLAVTLLTRMRREALRRGAMKTGRRRVTRAVRSRRKETVMMGECAPAVVLAVGARAMLVHCDTLS
jgi:hypothetical protein